MKAKIFMMAVLCAATFSLWADENAVLIDGPEVDLTVQDFKRALAALPPEVRGGMLRDKNRLRNVMDTTYMAKVAAHRAKQRGLDKDPFVQARIWNRTLNVLASAEVDRAIDEKMTEKDLETLAKERYLLEKEEFRVPEKVSASHILLKTEGKNEKEVLKRLEEIRKAIVTGKLSFEDAAKKYSEGPSASRGGDLGTFSRGRMVKPFEDVAFSLKEGEVSQPVKTRYGYHLILVHKKEPGRQLTFDEVKHRLIKEVEGKVRKELATDYWLSIRDDTRVKLNEKMIDAFLEHPQWDLRKDSAATKH